MFSKCLVLASRVFIPLAPCLRGCFKLAAPSSDVWEGARLSFHVWQLLALRLLPFERFKLCCCQSQATALSFINPLY